MGRIGLEDTDTIKELKEQIQMLNCRVRCLEAKVLPVPHIQHELPVENCTTCQHSTWQFADGLNQCFTWKKNIPRKIRCQHYKRRS